MSHLPTARSDLSVVPAGASPVVVGGYDGAASPTALLTVGADGSVRPHGRLVQGVRYAATAVVGHTAYVFGGEVAGRELDTVQAVDLRTGVRGSTGTCPFRSVTPWPRPSVPGSC